MERPATQEDQSLHERIVYNAMNYMHDKGSQRIAQMVQSGDPVGALMQVVKTIVVGLRKKGVEVPYESLAPAVDEIIMLLAEIMDGMDMRPSPEELDQIRTAFWEHYMGEHAQSGNLDLQGMGGPLEPGLQQAGLASEPTEGVQQRGLLS